MSWLIHRQTKRIVRLVGNAITPNLLVIEERCTGPDAALASHKVRYAFNEEYEYAPPECNGFDWKPEPKVEYIPFTRNTYPRDAWIKCPSGLEYRAVAIDDDGVMFTGGNKYTWGQLLALCTIDNKPAGTSMLKIG